MFQRRMTQYVAALNGQEKEAVKLPLTRDAELRIPRLSPQARALEFRQAVEAQARNVRTALKKNDLPNLKLQTAKLLELLDEI